MPTQQFTLSQASVSGKIFTAPTTTTYNVTAPTTAPIYVNVYDTDGTTLLQRVKIQPGTTTPISIVAGEQITIQIGTSADVTVTVSW